jgi:hypothetical protein
MTRFLAIGFSSLCRTARGTRFLAIGFSSLCRTARGIPASRAALVSLALGLPAAALAQAPPVTPPTGVRRATGPIDIDGKLDDAGWKDAVRFDRWYETNPGDNVEPKAKSVGWLAYDDRFFYAAFEFSDPDPAAIRAPYADRDNVGSDTDYGGVILDTRNDARTGVMFLANPRGIQYDAVNDDSSGSEDTAPDFFWESRARLTERGWVLELRVPFSSLRYPKTDPATWGVLLYRNWPREYRYQMFHTPLPRGRGCFICNGSKLTGLTALPAGGAVVIAPYGTANHSREREESGTELADGAADGEVGLDVKWTPTASVALDATVNPDFSQIESDVAQIGANERFALFYPEKRPFFQEGVELLNTPINAIYTRTITDPRWGTRGTGKAGRLAWMGLLADDAGGGTTIIPGPQGSSFADQDIGAYVGVARLRADVGTAYIGALATLRELDGSGHNRVAGPDFQWEIVPGDKLTGQLLWSDSLTPQRPDLAEEWDGRRLRGLAGHAWFQHSRAKHDAFVEYRDFGDEFRADNGFVPQVGFREILSEAGYTFRPTGFLRRIRTFGFVDQSMERDGDVIERQASLGAGMDGRFGSFARVRLSFDRVRVDDVELPRTRVVYDISANPARWLTQVGFVGSVGEQVDLANARAGTGLDVSARATLRPTDHLELKLNSARRWVDVDEGRVFTSQVQRVRATYTFTARSFVRGILQYQSTERDPALHVDEVSAHSEAWSGSFLFAYKLNWQTVLFLGYGDEREYADDTLAVEPLSRSLFLKISYAFQRRL